MSSGEDKIRLKIKELETEYARTQKNKATEGHLGLLKAKLSKLRRELLGEWQLMSYVMHLAVLIINAFTKRRIRISGEERRRSW